jgi:predicted dehydrogenase
MTLQIGVIGLGVGEQHVEAFRAHPDCKVVSVADPDPAQLAMAAQKWPEIARQQRPEAVIEDASIDVVCVASPDDAHYQQIVLALQGGKHVFAEKPLCLFEEHTLAIWQLLARSPQLRLSSNTVLRRSPRFHDLRARIKRGELGEIFMVDADYNYGRLWKLTEGWRGGIADYSVMLGGGVHMVDLVMWLTGRKVTEVYAFGSDISSKGTRFKGNDVVIAAVKFDDGSVGKLAANFGCVEPHFHRLTVYGTEATFENGRGTAKLYRSRDPNEQPEQLYTLYPAVAKGALIPSFVEAILRNRRPDVDENEVFEAMAVCHAIDRSLAQGVPSRVAYYDKLPQGRVYA